MKRSVVMALLSVYLLAAYVRLLPLTRYLYWGADFGEYFLVTRLLAEGLPLPTPYQGWGVTYPDFPGMHVLVASVSWAGIPLEAAATMVVPLLSALTVVPVYLMGREITSKDWPSLLAAAVVAVAMPHVYPTSHAIPAALGDLLVASSLLLLLRLRHWPGMLLLLLPISLALTLTHHLSSYFLIIMAFMVPLLRVLLRGSTFREVRTEALFVAILTTVNVAYWTLYADSFRDFLGVERFPWWLTAILILLLPLYLLPLSRLRGILRWSYRPTFPPPARGWRVFGLAALLTSLILLLFYYTAVPGTTVSVSQASILFSAPYLLLFLLAAPGRKHFDFLPGGPHVTSWFLALNLSWILGGVLAPTFLIPYRHLEYLTIPLALFGGMGALQLWRTLRRRRAVLLAALAVAVILSAGTSIPPREALGNHFEGTRPQGMNVVYWSTGRLEGVVATDHRVSSTLFGLAGVRATWDTVSLPLHAASFQDARAEMEWVEELPGGPGRIDYVLLDGDLVRGAMLLPWDPALPLSPAAQAKFQSTPYVKIYDDGYSQLFWVNWGAA